MKNLYENGCACVRWNNAEKKYEVYASRDDGDMQLDSWYSFTGEGVHEDENLTKAKARCNLLKDGPTKTIEGREVVYSNGCAAVCDDEDDDYFVYVLDRDGSKYIKADGYYRWEHGKARTLLLAKKHCDRLAFRGERRRIFLSDYPDTPD